MPKKTTHVYCDFCEEKARVCTYLRYYGVLGDRSRKGFSHKQVNGTLPPTKGYCLSCFMSVAKRRGLSRSELKTLRQRFEGGQVKRTVQGSRTKIAVRNAGPTRRK